ncbi:hypothetical protein Dda_2396 [Drechslerella dactyloides]|uniref:F-box domain-containing protein n=1 Tax=Drechslerella dactyloides TaxID=74499 RepID=A0AAD6J5C3_DREDA|nr:hypothetical protein Dda_2396 [Drechslerella dactyloides]
MASRSSDPGIMQTAPMLRLPCELHEKIAEYISNAHDTIAFSNTSRLLRQRLQSSNHVWYGLLKHAGSVKDEFDAYDPKRDYLAWVQQIRSRKRLRCQICLAIGPVRTVDIDNIFYGVYCQSCLDARFYDMKAFQQVYDNFWDGFVNPPQFEVPRFLVAKGYSELSKNGATHPFSRSSCRQPALYVLKSDASKLLRALIQSEEAVEECFKLLKARNEEVEKAGRQDPSTLIRDVLDIMVEDYEVHHRQLHREQSPDEFREYWHGNIWRILDRPSSDAETRGSREGQLKTAVQSWAPVGLSKGAQLLHRLGIPPIPGRTPEM